MSSYIFFPGQELCKNCTKKIFRQSFRIFHDIPKQSPLLTVRNFTRIALTTPGGKGGDKVDNDIVQPVFSKNAEVIKYPGLSVFFTKQNNLGPKTDLFRSVKLLAGLLERIRFASSHFFGEGAEIWADLDRGQLLISSSNGSLRRNI